MNCTVFILECAIMMAIFGVLVFGLLLINPVTFVSDYPPEIQERYYNSQNKVSVKEKLTKIMIVKKSSGFDHICVCICMDGTFGGSPYLLGRADSYLWVYYYSGDV